MVRFEDMTLTYTGAWTRTDHPACGMGSRHDAVSRAPASAVWEGYCTGFELYGTKGPFGIARIYVDGALHGEADYHSDAEEHGSVVYAAAGLAPGFHTVEIRKAGDSNPDAAGSGINVDYLKAALTRPSDIRCKSIVCIGDSITFGANVAWRPVHLFGRRLQHMLYTPVSIHGLSGAGIRLITDVLESVVVPRRPDLVIWLAGMNDPEPGPELENGLNKLMSLLPETRILAATIPFNTFYTEQQNMDKVNGVLEVCRRMGVPCADLYHPTWGSTALNAPEGTVHPNDEGHGVIAGLLYREWVARLNRPASGGMS